MASERKRAAIMDAFIAMINEMPLESVRTEELITRAGVSRSTFYRLFHDKYDVMNSIFLLQSKKTVYKDPHLSNWKEWARMDLTNIQQHILFYQNIISYKGQNSFSDSLVEYYRNNMQRHIGKYFKEGDLPEEVAFSIEVHIQVSVFAVIWWIRGNCETPIETLISYLEGCIPRRIRYLFD